MLDLDSQLALTGGIGIGAGAAGRVERAKELAPAGDSGKGGKIEAVTFGPGATAVHPWTHRNDNGINSRLPDNTRGPEIYYVGVIDILQRYNLRKRAETIIKVRHNTR
jgi:hypothetical protein